MRTLTLTFTLTLTLTQFGCTQPAAGPPSAAAPAPVAAAPVAADPPRTMPSPVKPTTPTTAAAPTENVPAGAKTFGAPLAGNVPVPLAAVLTEPDRFAGKPVTVEGKVRANCTRKGCWMELASSMDKAAPGCRVTFKDYGFFVPLNSQGSDARVEGEVNVKTIPAAEVAHYEGEGGHFPNKLPDGSAREVRFVASGVALWRLN